MGTNEKKSEEKQAEQKKGIIVVDELPTEPIRMVSDKEGKEYEIVTSKEAQSEMLEILRGLKKQFL